MLLGHLDAGELEVVAVDGALDGDVVAGHEECAAKCVKEHDAKYVFVNDSDHKVYAIDAQDKVAEHEATLDARRRISAFFHTHLLG